MLVGDRARPVFLTSWEMLSRSSAALAQRLFVDAVAFPLVADAGRMVSAVPAFAPTLVVGVALLGVLVLPIPRSIAGVTVNPLLRCVVLNAAVLVVIIVFTSRARRFLLLVTVTRALVLASVAGVARRAAVLFIVGVPIARVFFFVRACIRRGDAFAVRLAPMVTRRAALRAPRIVQGSGRAEHARRLHTLLIRKKNEPPLSEEVTPRLAHVCAGRAAHAVQRYLQSQSTKKRNRQIVVQK